MFIFFTKTGRIRVHFGILDCVDFKTFFEYFGKSKIMTTVNLKFVHSSHFPKPFTVKVWKIQKPEKFAVVTLKFNKKALP